MLSNNTSFIVCCMSMYCRRSQHTNDSVSNQTADYGQPLSAKFVKDTSKYWYKPHIGRDEGSVTRQPCVLLNLLSHFLTLN